MPGRRDADADRIQFMEESRRPTDAQDRSQEGGEGGNRPRKGSRLGLAAALAAVVAAAFCAGAVVGTAAADLLGIASDKARLVLKLVGVAVAVPAGFYVVERVFLKRSSRP